MGELARVEKALSDVFGFFNTLDENTDALIAIMPTLDDIRLIQISQTAAELGSSAWRIEAAAHHEIIKRTDSQQGKRTDLGSLGAGRNLAAIAAAREAHLDVSTIRRNAQLFRLFVLEAPQLILNVQNKLTDKGFYEAAARADDPYGRLIEFSQIKEAKRTFTVREAHKMVMEETTPALSEIIESAGLAPQAEVGFRAFKAGCHTLADAVPILKGTLSGYTSDIQYELTRPTQTIRDIILAKVKEGCQTIEDLSRELNRPRVHMNVLLKHMVEDGWLIKGYEEKTKGARGARRAVYKDAQGKPVRERRAPFEMYIDDEEDVDGEE